MEINLELITFSEPRFQNKAIYHELSFELILFSFAIALHGLFDL
jgi:hypothetical protein